MTQEKELLLKDLCARIPYGVKILHQGWNYECDDELSTLERVTGIDEKFIYTKVIDTHNGEEYRNDKHSISLLDDKPYLFPLSSITYRQKCTCPIGFTNLETFIKNEDWSFIEISPNSLLDFINWCYKNHLDINGLTPLGLAIDATNLNIY